MTSRAATLLLALSLLAACGSEATPLPAEQAEQAEVLPLPLGLVQVEGTEAIGRPLTFDHVGMISNGEPIESLGLRAAYRVTGDPNAVMQAWAEQLVPLGFGDVHLSLAASNFDHSPLAEIGALAEWDPDALGAGWVGAQLWATGERPILIVSIDRHHAGDAVPSVLVPDGGSVAASAEPQLEASPPAPGEVLFTEQGDTVRVPDGARALMPVIPTVAGTGGSTSLLAVAGDEVAVIDAMLSEAGSQNEHGEVTGPDVEHQDGTRVVTAWYGVGASGWGFRVVAVRGPGDPDAMLWVTSYAD